MRIKAKIKCQTCKKSFVGWKDGNKMQACCSTECLIEAKESGKVKLNSDGSVSLYRTFVPKEEVFTVSGVKSKSKRKRNVYREVHLKALAFAGVKEGDFCDYDD